MRHSLSISISKAPMHGTVSCGTVQVRERLLTKLLGRLQTVTILIPDETVDQVTITEGKEGGDQSETV